MDEVEGAFLGVVGTFRDIGIRVIEGTSDPQRFTFYLSMNAQKRWLTMAKALISDHRGYILRVGKILQPSQTGSLKYTWMVSIEADRIVVAADKFRKALYGTYDLVRKIPVYNIEEPEEA